MYLVCFAHNVCVCVCEFAATYNQKTILLMLPLYARMFVQCMILFDMTYVVYTRINVYAVEKYVPDV